jgi:hypothetical protein
MTQRKHLLMTIPLFYRQLMNTVILRNISLLFTTSIIITLITCTLNFWLLSFNSRITPTNVTFLEGIIFITFGILLFLGSGGINRASRQAALLAATANAVADKQVIGPSDIFRKDAWKPKGFTFWALALIIAGLILMCVYFALL